MNRQRRVRHMLPGRAAPAGEWRDLKDLLRCCDGIVRQIRGKLFTERYEVTLWKFSFPCGARVSGLTHGFLVVENLHSLIIHFLSEG